MDKIHVIAELLAAVWIIYLLVKNTRRKKVIDKILHRVRVDGNDITGYMGRDNSKSLIKAYELEGRFNIVRKYDNNNMTKDVIDELFKAIARDSVDELKECKRRNE